MPIERKELPPRLEVSLGEDGKPVEKWIPQWEVNATGKEVHELEGIFKESAPQMMHETWKEWQSIGEETITKPDGSTDVVRADQVKNYRQIDGFCVKATRPTFVVNGFGGMRAAGLTRCRIRYHNGEREILEEK